MTTRSQTARPAAKRPASPTGIKAEATSPAAKKGARKVTLVEIKTTGQTGQYRQYLEWYRMNFADKIHAIRSGVPAQRLGELSLVMHMPKETLMDSLGLPRATINRKVQQEKKLSPQESERVMGIQALIGQVQAMIDTESAPEFDAARWLANWLVSPLPALGGATPASFMDTVEGQKYISNLLEMAQSGAYA